MKMYGPYQRKDGRWFVVFGGDGGDVDIVEQFRRMALDAKRYRWLTDCAGMDFEAMAPYQLIGRMSDRIDAAIKEQK